MRKTLTKLAATILLLAAALSGCGADSVAPKASTPSSTATEPLLAEHGLDGMGTAEIIDHLDRLGGAERPADMMASVRPAELVLSSGDDELSLEIPDDQFYLSVAPYVDQTHDCFHHSLTTCAGELAAEDVQVEIVDEDGKVLVDETRTTFENGFTGFWLPRDIEGTLRVTYDGKTGETEFATDEEAPTCLTTLQLV